MDDYLVGSFSLWNCPPQNHSQRTPSPEETRAGAEYQSQRTSQLHQNQGQAVLQTASAYTQCIEHAVVTPSFLDSTYVFHACSSGRSCGHPRARHFEPYTPAGYVLLDKLPGDRHRHFWKTTTEICQHPNVCGATKPGSCHHFPKIQPFDLRRLNLLADESPRPCGLTWAAFHHHRLESQVINLALLTVISLSFFHR